MYHLARIKFQGWFLTALSLLSPYLLLLVELLLPRHRLR